MTLILHISDLSIEKIENMPEGVSLDSQPLCLFKDPSDENVWVVYPNHFFSFNLKTKTWNVHRHPEAFNNQKPAGIFVYGASVTGIAAPRVGVALFSKSRYEIMKIGGK